MMYKLTLAALEENHLANRVVVVENGEEALNYLYHWGKFKMRSGGNPIVVLLDKKRCRSAKRGERFTHASFPCKMKLRVLITSTGDRRGFDSTADTEAFEKTKRALCAADL